MEVLRQEFDFNVCGLMHLFSSIVVYDNHKMADKMRTITFNEKEKCLRLVTLQLIILDLLGCQTPLTRRRMKAVLLI